MAHALEKFVDEERIDVIHSHFLHMSQYVGHKRGAAFVFQSLALFPHLTALDNVVYGIDRKLPDRRARAQKMLERMHVAHLADRRPQTFSEGGGATTVRSTSLLELLVPTALTALTM